MASELPCRRCGNVLAETTPHQLVFSGDRPPAGVTSGGCVIRQTVVLVCRKCGASRKWRPVLDATPPRV